ncbi:TetR/AcrR family transcriptional regulator [Algicella marina]|uniref:TetR family transcriptional regulator n=1 Tax=Algicella marina TaxID=2683284 RepID=A0A6P1T1R9_9RHOB|nr:TetR/AcrR family transcriptional regulator [Algicella marina]QHQ34472.1 TetR family transcriptional regulator [Algicella marina]
MSSEISGTPAKILNAALTLLEQGGPVRMADIARAAGISRQALYLHYPNRADLLIAATRHLDEIKNIDDRLADSRGSESGLDRLAAYIDCWAAYIPEVYGVARALMAMKDTDAEAATAWAGRMQAFREGCEAAIRALAEDDTLAPDHSIREATDILWTMLSIRTWEHFRQDCGWSQERYAETMQTMARTLLTTAPASA